MSVVTIGGFDVLSGMVKTGIRGRWYFKGQIESTDTVPFDVPATLDIGGDPWVGTMISATADDGNLVTVEAVGGQNGLDDEVFPLHYYQSTVGIILKDILAIGGEFLAIDADSDILGLPVEHYTRTKGTVREAIGALLKVAEELGGVGAEVLTWHIDVTGSLWFGRQIFFPFDLDSEIVEESPEERNFTIELEHASALPGRIIMGHDVSDVVYVISPGGLRATCWYAPDEEHNLVDQEWDSLIRKRTAHLDLAAPIGFDVVNDNQNGTLNLKSTDPRFPDMASVPMRGAPGTTELKLLPGRRVLVCHENGNPSKPYVWGYGFGEAQSVKMTFAESMEVTSPMIKMGGQEAMVKQIPFVAWVAALTSACAAMGISVPPFPDPGTVILKGS